MQPARYSALADAMKTVRGYRRGKHKSMYSACRIVALSHDGTYQSCNIDEGIGEHRGQHVPCTPLVKFLCF